MTCDQNHAYGPEQKAADNGAMDKFVEKAPGTPAPGCSASPAW